MPVNLIDAALALPDHRVTTRRGNVAVASWDQDVVTLGAQAALEVLERNPDSPPTALYLASASAPYAEGSNVALLAEVLGLAADCIGAEFGGTVAAGAAALTASLDRQGTTLVVAADSGRGTDARRFGDGACAWLLGAIGEVASLESLGSGLSWFMDRWRLDGVAEVTEADRSLRAVSPGKAFAAKMESHLHVDDANPPLDRAGFIGSATYLASTVLACADLAEGEELRATASAGGASYGIGLTVGSAAGEIAKRFGDRLAAGQDEGPPPTPDVAGFEPYTSEARRWRERGADLRLEGSTDPASGAAVYPPVPGGVPVQLQRTGEVFTHTTDYVFPLGGPVSMAVVELDGGGRFYGQVIDGLPVEIGQRVHLVLRRLHMGGGVPQYFWKIAPEGRS